jgi:hypothetical protein
MSHLRGAKRVVEIEVQGVRLAKKLADLGQDWDNRVSHLRARYPQAWKHFAEERGLSADYTFADLVKRAEACSTQMGQLTTNSDEEES